MKDPDWDQVSWIYYEGIITGNATFESEVPSQERWNAGHIKECSIVARQGEIILGWASLSHVSSRRVYSGVAEVSIYVGNEYRGMGIGSMLLDSLISISELNGIWTLQASVFPENVTSISMYKKCGFREVGRRERPGKMNGIWRDVVLLERRSTKAGID